MRLGAAHHALPPPVRDDGLRDFCARPVVTIEGALRKRAIELRAIGRELRLQSVKYFFGKAVWIGRRLQHQRRHRADQRSLRHPAFAMPSQIMRHLAAAGGMTNVHGVLEIKMRGQSRKVVGVMIHVMAVARLGGPAVASSVMGDDAIAVFEEEQHLRVPVIGRQRPAVAKDDGLSFAPVLVIDIDVSSVFFPDSYVWHTNFLSLEWFIACISLGSFLSAYDVGDHLKLGHRAFAGFWSAKNEIPSVPSFEIQAELPFSDDLQQKSAPFKSSSVGATSSRFIFVTFDGWAEARLRIHTSAFTVFDAAFALRNFQEGFYEKFFSLEPAPGRIAFCIRVVGDAERRGAGYDCIAHCKRRRRAASLSNCW